MRGKNDLLYLQHILESLQLIDEYLHKTDITTFEKSRQLQDAVVRRFEVMGEAAKRVSSDTKEEYKNIPWRYMAGMRDRLIHDYEMVDYELVWSTYINDLPNVAKSIQDLVRKIQIENESTIHD